MFNPNTDEFTRDCETMIMKELIEKYGVSKNTIQRKKKELGISKWYLAAGRLDINTDDVVADYESGMTINELRNKYHCSHDTITKRLASKGISNSRAEGIKRHFEPTYEERWPGIKEDLDVGASIRYVRDKYHIREDNLKKLMADHGYVYGNQNAVDRLNVLIKQTESDKGDNKRDFHNLDYMYALRSYMEEFERMPTARELSKYMGIAYTNVTKCIKKYDLKTFLAHNNETSDMMLKLRQTLDDRGVIYELNNRKILPENKEIDVWLPDLKIGIEVNPFGTHSIDTEIGITDRKYHQNKSLAALDAGIPLVHLYDEDVIDEKRYNKIINLICLKPSYHIGARECDIKQISRVEANLFLNKYHIQGGENASDDRVALTYNDNIVGVLCFGKSRFAKADAEILRYCMHPDYAVSGGFAKMFAYMKSKYDKGSVIVSYMDLNKRFRVESVYDNNGFTCEDITPPDYVWVESHGKEVLKRYDTMKSKLIAQGFDGNLTEVEIMRSRHYCRVFGAGSKRYLYTI